MIKPPNLGDFSEGIDIDGNVIISGSKLREFFPPQVKLMSNQMRDLCVCETFILARSI